MANGTFLHAVSSQKWHEMISYIYHLITDYVIIKLMVEEDSTGPEGGNVLNHGQLCAREVKFS